MEGVLSIVASTTADQAEIFRTRRPQRARALAKSPSPDSLEVKQQEEEEKGKRERVPPMSILLAALIPDAI